MNVEKDLEDKRATGAEEIAGNVVTLAFVGAFPKLRFAETDMAGKVGKGCARPTFCLEMVSGKC